MMASTGGQVGPSVAVWRRTSGLYRFLVMNRQPGDDIYLFGFSRGCVHGANARRVHGPCPPILFVSAWDTVADTLFTRPADWTGTLEQAWFPGLHCNVGGSYDPDGLANEALHWIAEKAEDLGLDLNDEFLKFYVPCFNSVLQDSMTVMYWTIQLGRGHVRPIGKMEDGEAVHQSAIDRMKLAECDYAPANLQAYLSSGSTQGFYPVSTDR